MIEASTRSRSRWRDEIRLAECPVSAIIEKAKSTGEGMVAAYQCGPKIASISRRINVEDSPMKNDMLDVCVVRSMSLVGIDGADVHTGGSRVPRFSAIFSFRSPGAGRLCSFLL